MFQHESPSHNTHKLSDLLEPATVGDKHQSSRPHVVSASPLPLQNPEMWMQISVPLHISCFLLRRDLPSQDWLLIIILNIVCTEQLRLAAGTAALCSYILHVSAALLLCFWGQTSPFQLISLCRQLRLC